MTVSEPQQQLQKRPEDKLVVVSQGRPPYPVRAQAAFGVSPGDWRALVDAIFPLAKTTESVELALSYCRARKLDIFKRPIHIVPIWDSNRGAEVESVWPGIGELRTTASRTGEHAGYDEAVFGPLITMTFKGTVGKGQYVKDVEKTVTYPEWAQITVYRLVKGQRMPYPSPKVEWLETYATMGKSDVPNEMWANRPKGQIEKCAEAAALRRAFPEEIGSDYIPEEVGGRRAAIDITPVAAPALRGASSVDRLDAFAAPSRPEPEPDAAEVQLEPSEPASGEPDALSAHVCRIQEFAVARGISLERLGLLVPDYLNMPDSPEFEKEAIDRLRKEKK